MSRSIKHVACFVVAGVGLAACAPKQRIPLDLGPAPVVLFVDGEQAEPVPPELELRADRDHKLFVKRAGYLPELVVLEARGTNGRDGLVPDRVRVRLRPETGDRDIEIEEIEEVPSEDLPTDRGEGNASQ